jgi:5'-deoxynucleotidase YfbR-like HD superfamily hydrolase
MSYWFYEQGRYREAKWAAFHEGDEVFFGDIITPVKYLDVFAPVREIIKDTQRAVYKQFKLYGTEPKSIKKLDNAMKILEARKIKPNCGLAKEEVPKEFNKVKVKIFSSHKKCEEEFLALVNKIEAALAS